MGQPKEKIVLVDLSIAKGVCNYLERPLLPGSGTIATVGDSKVEGSEINDLPDSREAIITDLDKSIGLAFNRSEEVDLVDRSSRMFGTQVFTKLVLNSLIGKVEVSDQQPAVRRTITERSSKDVTPCDGTGNHLSN